MNFNFSPHMFYFENLIFHVVLIVFLKNRPHHGNFYLQVTFLSLSWSFWVWFGINKIHQFSHEIICLNSLTTIKKWCSAVGYHMLGITTTTTALNLRKICSNFNKHKFHITPATTTIRTVSKCILRHLHYFEFIRDILSSTCKYIHCKYILL